MLLGTDSGHSSLEVMYDDPPEHVRGVDDEEEEEDYMSMTIVEPQKPKEKETYTQRRIRKERESEQKGRTKSKKQLAAEAAATRESSLANPLSSSSKGFKMMEKFGFKQGQSLGAANNRNARLEPVELQTKDDRGGIGMDSEKKRKIREQYESEAKRVKAEEGDFRERVAKEREEKRAEGMLFGAMKVAERLDTGSERGTRTSFDTEICDEEKAESVPLCNVNVLWRSLVKERMEKERERRMRYDLMQSLSRNVQYDDPEEDKQDRIALGKEEEQIEEEDPELDDFLQLPLVERLHKLVIYLREAHNYCFWCKYQYSDSTLEGCPGTTEEDHD